MDREMAVGISESIDGWMTRRELEWLFETASSIQPGGTWVELGAWKGRSFFTVSMGLPARSQLVAIDSFASATAALPHIPTTTWVWDHFMAVFQGVQRLRQDLVLSVMRSETSHASQLFADDSIDLVFFDADHTREGLLHDVDAWMPKIRPGGTLCGHDYSTGFPGVVELVDELFPERTIIADTSIWLATRR